MITPLKQSDPRWGSLRLGTGNGTIGQVGCFITALSSLAHTTPDVTNKLMTEQGGYLYGNLVVSSKAARILDLPYEGRVASSPLQTRLCIAETNHFAPRVPQHFFVWLGDGRIMDPLDGQIKSNPYKLVSFRLFGEKKEGQLDPAIEAWIKDKGIMDGSRLDEAATRREVALMLYRATH
jgi:hypothetical protein